MVIYQFEKPRLSVNEALHQSRNYNTSTGTIQNIEKIAFISSATRNTLPYYETQKRNYYKLVLFNCNSL